MKIIGERLRSLRESVRLSQAKLAKEFDVSQSALARYEIDDSTPSPEVFLKYADYFDVSLDYIFGRTDDPHGMIYNNSSPRPPEAAKRPTKGGVKRGAPIHPMIYHSRVVRMTRPRMRQGPVVRTMGV